MNLAAIFLTGLTSGGIACLAVQGGLLAGIIANQKKEQFKVGLNEESKDSENKEALNILPVSMFLTAKIVSHTILGFLLGILGSVFTLSLANKLLFQILVAIFMLATAMNLLNVHPIFRYLVIQPPKFIRKMIKNSSKSKAIFTPIILGLLSIFIPCGVTQAMEVTAIGSGNAVDGALIMLAFTLGTSPLFAIIGMATAKLSNIWHARFLKITALALILMSLVSINGVMSVVDSPFTAAKIWAQISGSKNSSGEIVVTKDEVQKVKLNISSKGYEPKKIQVKAGIPVELTLVSNNVRSCALDFVFKEFGIHQTLKSTDSVTVKFTPNKKGVFTYSCSMGMYTGVMEVI